jgi:oligopeptide/dipeptide ABC transporter ATP-binding protein
VLDTINVPDGCRFGARCHRIHDGIRARCNGEEPPLAEIGSGHRVRCWLYRK